MAFYHKRNDGNFTAKVSCKTANTVTNRVNFDFRRIHTDEFGQINE